MRDVVIAGINRDEISALVILDLDGCRLVNPALASDDIAASGDPDRPVAIPDDYDHNDDGAPTAAASATAGARGRRGGGHRLQAG